jgi:hypothetical protein
MEGACPERTGVDVFLYVSDADALHTEWTQSGLGAGLGEPYDTAYGPRKGGFVDVERDLNPVATRVRKSGQVVTTIHKSTPEPSCPPMN